ncbi:MAG: hypothetical protein Q8Q87_03345, partial [Candidatus Omnitrophota bacterium]|nr:hypothetical protein [Candidatus Omnitrophota bacterium]
MAEKERIEKKGAAPGGEVGQDNAPKAVGSAKEKLREKLDSVIERTEAIPVELLLGRSKANKLYLLSLLSRAADENMVEGAFALVLGISFNNIFFRIIMECAQDSAVKIYVTAATKEAFEVALKGIINEKKRPEGKRTPLEVLEAAPIGGRASRPNGLFVHKSPLLRLEHNVGAINIRTVAFSEKESVAGEGKEVKEILMFINGGPFRPPFTERYRIRQFSSTSLEAARHIHMEVVKRVRELQNAGARDREIVEAVDEVIRAENGGVVSAHMTGREEKELAASEREGLIRLAGENPEILKALIAVRGQAGKTGKETRRISSTGMTDDKNESAPNELSRDTVNQEVSPGMMSRGRFIQIVGLFLAGLFLTDWTRAFAGPDTAEVPHSTGEREMLSEALALLKEKAPDVSNYIEE